MPKSSISFDSEQVIVQKPNELSNKRSGFGDQSIGYLGSVCLLCNNIIGPGLLQLPSICQAAGWLPSALALICISCTSTWSAIHLAAAAEMLRARDLSEGRCAEMRPEYGALCYRLFPRWAYLLALSTLVFFFIVNNISNILVAAQTMDDMILFFAGVDCALILRAPSANASTAVANGTTGGGGGVDGGGSGWQAGHVVCVSNTTAAAADSPFGDAMVVSWGYLATAAAAVPLSLVNLDDNAGVQVGAVIVTLGCLAIWGAQFCALGLQWDLLPVWVAADGRGLSAYAAVVPTMMFNYGFVASVPSWLAEKAPAVAPAPAIWRAQMLSTAQYAAFALLGALAVDWSGPLAGVDAAAAVAAGAIPGAWTATHVAVFVFPVANILTSIPVFSIMTRYNLLQLQSPSQKSPETDKKSETSSGWFHVVAANLVAVAVPWAAALFFFGGDLLGDLITWSSALLFVQINFVFPLCLRLAAETHPQLPQKLPLISSHSDVSNSLPRVPPRNVPTISAVALNEGLNARLLDARSPVWSVRGGDLEDTKGWQDWFSEVDDDACSGRETEASAAKPGQSSRRDISAAAGGLQGARWLLAASSILGVAVLGLQVLSAVLHKDA